MYPFPEETIADLAYHFEAKESRECPYFEPLSQEITRWNRIWDDRHCTLTWETAGDEILINNATEFKNVGTLVENGTVVNEDLP